MPDFNKGDFTQQGVAGHVNTNLRLNEKRLVNIDLTSNEEAEGCTIAGTVKDLLNDKVYNIGSAPSGNIEITENTTEPLDIAQYATATVNVAGGGADVRKCVVTVQNTSANIGQTNVLTFNEANGCLAYSDGNVPANGNATLTFTVRYDQLALGYMPINFWESFRNLDTGGNPPSFSDLVNITIDERFNPVLTDPTTDASLTVRVGFIDPN